MKKSVFKISFSGAALIFAGSLASGESIAVYSPIDLDHQIDSLASALEKSSSDLEVKSIIEKFMLSFGKIQFDLSDSSCLQFRSCVRFTVALTNVSGQSEFTYGNAIKDVLCEISIISKDVYGRENDIVKNVRSGIELSLLQQTQLSEIQNFRKELHAGRSLILTNLVKSYFNYTKGEVAFDTLNQLFGLDEESRVALKEIFIAEEARRILNDVCKKLQLQGSDRKEIADSDAILLSLSKSFDQLNFNPSDSLDSDLKLAQIAANYLIYSIQSKAVSKDKNSLAKEIVLLKLLKNKIDEAIISEWIEIPIYPQVPRGMPMATIGMNPNGVRDIGWRKKYWDLIIQNRANLLQNQQQKMLRESRNKFAWSLMSSAASTSQNGLTQDDLFKLFCQTDNDRSVFKGKLPDYDLDRPLKDFHRSILVVDDDVVYYEKILEKFNSLLKESDFSANKGSAKRIQMLSEISERFMYTLKKLTKPLNENSKAILVTRGFMSKISAYIDPEWKPKLQDGVGGQNVQTTDLALLKDEQQHALLKAREKLVKNLVSLSSMTIKDGWKRDEILRIFSTDDNSKLLFTEEFDK